MATYLLVVDGTSGGTEFVAAARKLARRDLDAEFVLVAPATPPAFDVLLFEPRCTGTAYARFRSRRAKQRLLDAGLHIVAARLGNFDTVRAIEDSTRYTDYAAVVVETKPAFPLARMIHLDKRSRLARRFPNLRLICVPAHDVPLCQCVPRRSRQTHHDCVSLSRCRICDPGSLGPKVVTGTPRSSSS